MHEYFLVRTGIPMDTQTLHVESPSSRYAQARYVALASITGLLAGIVGSYFHLIIDWLVLWPHLVAQYYSGASLVIIAALITMVCTVFAAFVVRRVAPEASGR